MEMEGVSRRRSKPSQELEYNQHHSDASGKVNCQKIITLNKGKEKHIQMLY